VDVDTDFGLMERSSGATVSMRHRRSTLRTVRGPSSFANEKLPYGWVVEGPEDAAPRYPYGDYMKRPWLGWIGMWVALLVVAGAISSVAGTSPSEQWLFFAASILALTSFAHSLLGELFILQRLFRMNDLPRLFADERFLPQTLRFVWHLFSIALLGFTAVLISVANDPSSTSSETSRAISIALAASAVVAGVVSHGRHLSWAAFAIASVAIWLAS